jgi:cyclic pyranopterin phosphate synthase
MPAEKMEFMPSASLMQAAEIKGLAGVFIQLGVKKIRLTGGEPLFRKDAAQILQALSEYPVELTLTTNGFRTHEFIDVFRQCGITSINVSLDTLQKKKFFQITRRDAFERVFDNILMLVEKGFHVKVNSVIMRGVNDDEIIDFAGWTKNLPIHIRFIEFMPFTGNRWRKESVYTYFEILEQVRTVYTYTRMEDPAHATARKYQIPGHAGTFAVISTMSTPFCSDCNRLRLTADGKMKNCLFSKGEIDLLSAWRAGADVENLIRECLADKKEALGGQFTPDPDQVDAAAIENRSMISIGG